MKIFVSAAEISSDIHAEKILIAIQNKFLKQGKKVEWLGIGGPRVRALPAFQCIENAENLRTMGVVEVFKKIFFFKKLIKDCTQAIHQFKPDLILTFDYPDFHFRLIEEVVRKNLAPHALRICGIPPKVWIWRSNRVEKIRKFYHGVWVVFPFEKQFYESRSIPVIYEGNPLLDDLMNIKLSHELLKKPLETITVMPGSRDGEIKNHLPIIFKALQLFALRVGKKITAQIPIPQGVSDIHIKELLINSNEVEYQFLVGGSEQSLRETHLGLIKSGTSTLEAAVLNCVPIIFYKMNRISEIMLRFIIQTLGRYWGPVGLPNILLKVKDRKNVFFPEFIGEEANAENLSDALCKIYQSKNELISKQKKCEEVKSLFFLNDQNFNSAEKSAEKIISWLNQQPSNALLPPLNKNILICMVSVLWSSLNWVRRRMSQLGFISTFEVPVPSILVGNLQAGGSGKTPIVITIAKEAVRRGLKVAVVSRGYGRSAKIPMGDEPQEIISAVPEVLLSVNRNRVIAIKEALKNKPDIIVFDDGFQNLTFKSKLNLIAVTSRKRCEVAYRDFDSEIQFADLVLGTKGSIYRPVFLKREDVFHSIKWKWINQTQEPVWLVCAIADPSELITFYRSQGLVINKTIIKSDHASFDLDEIKKLITEAKANGCLLAMTQKDRVKIPTLLDEVYVLSREIVNHDWLNVIFERLQCVDSESKIDNDESL